MKKLVLCGFTCFCALLLFGCCTPSSVYPTVNNRVETNPACWLNGADHWFLTGEPMSLNNYYHPIGGHASSLSEVHVNDFSKISFDGDGVLQIMGGQEHNSVAVTGSCDTVSTLSFKVHHGTLIIHQAQNPDAPLSPEQSKQMLIRLGVRELRELVKKGNGDLYGRGIQSRALRIYAGGSGKVMLVGNMNVYNIIKNGLGELALFGVNAPVVDMNVNGGTVKIAGNVGTHCIINRNAEVTIVGANSDSLGIFATGLSRTVLMGIVNLQRLFAHQRSCIYINQTRSCNASVLGTEQASIALGGMTNSLNLTLRGSAHFEGTRLITKDAFVRTYLWSHANVNAKNKLFSEAHDESSLYYYGGTPLVSRFTTSHGKIFAIGS